MGNGEREGSLGRAGDLPARPAARPPAASIISRSSSVMASSG